MDFTDNGRADQRSGICQPRARTKFFNCRRVIRPKGAALLRAKVHADARHHAPKRDTIFSSSKFYVRAVTRQLASRIGGREPDRIPSGRIQRETGWIAGDRVELILGEHEKTIRRENGGGRRSEADRDVPHTRTETDGGADGNLHPTTHRSRTGYGSGKNQGERTISSS